MYEYFISYLVRYHFSDISIDWGRRFTAAENKAGFIYTVNIDGVFLITSGFLKNIYESKMSSELIGQTLVFLLVFNILLILTSMVFAKANRFDRKLSSTFKNSMVLSNLGNYGLPISVLVFAANPAGMSIQIIISIFQNLLTLTYGFFNSVSAQSSGRDIIRKIIRLPVIYALILAISLKWLRIEIPPFLWKPIENGLVVIYSLGLTGITAQGLFIASSFPTSRNSALLALEYDNYPEYASQAVLLTTVISSITVAVYSFYRKFSLVMDDIHSFRIPYTAMSLPFTRETFSSINLHEF